ncbi:MAG: hypothetical protein MUC56_09215 [Thermoanaerobaculales bacterium]|jgi:hypothetical protein|nr:hypothetical protein [Thermoanaerobaculales bacterium]
MAEPDIKLTYWRYLMEAFQRRTKIPFLGQLPLNSMALAGLVVAGMFNPGFWLLGLGGEILYLYLRASSPRFQRLIQAEQLLASQRSWSERVETVVARLSGESRHRYRSLLQECRRILGMSEALEDNSLGNFRDLRTRSLNQLLGIFLRLLSSRDTIREHLSSLERKVLEHEIGELERRLAAADPASPLARSLEGTLAIQRKRLDNHQRALDSLAVINAELERIERQVQLIREESAVGASPDALSYHLDSVASTMRETSRWMEENAELLGALGADDAATALPELPMTAIEEEPNA